MTNYARISLVKVSMSQPSKSSISKDFPMNENVTWMKINNGDMNECELWMYVLSVACLNFISLSYSQNSSFISQLLDLLINIHSVFPTITKAELFLFIRKMKVCSRWEGRATLLNTYMPPYSTASEYLMMNRCRGWKGWDTTKR
jgi:hypothetical protein